MKYYSINKVSDDLKAIGHYPQLEFRKGYNPNKNGCWNVERNNFPDFIPNYELELHPKAKPTNFLPIYSIGFGMIVDKNLKEVLSNFKLPKHHFYNNYKH